MSTEPAGGTISGNSTDTNTITDRQLFDHAISTPDPTPAASPREDGRERPDASPSSSQPSSTGQPASTRPDLQQGAQTPGQPRDPQGKFAPKPQGQQGQQHNVPLGELLKERDARQRLEAHAQELTRAVMDLQQRLSPQQPQQPQGPETIFDDPRTYLDQNVMAPMRAEMQAYGMKVKDDVSRTQANMQFGEQEVNAALVDIGRIRQTPQGNFVFNQIMQSGHPYGELVKWHRTVRAQQAIGADPQAWLRQQQQAWAENEKVQDYVMQMRAKRLGAQKGNPPNVQLPPSLSSVRSSSGRMDNGGDLSSASLYDFATK
jgi:alkylated DNA nucleotide flippase Atl1